MWDAFSASAGAVFRGVLQIEANKVMLYMKGTPSEPRCGFSAQVVRILHTQGRIYCLLCCRTEVDDT